MGELPKPPGALRAGRLAGEKGSALPGCSFRLSA
jgi:hypothetical protein